MRPDPDATIVVVVGLATFAPPLRAVGVHVGYTTSVAGATVIVAVSVTGYDVAVATFCFTASD